MLKARRAGRLTFLPLNKIRAAAASSGGKSGRLRAALDGGPGRHSAEWVVAGLVAPRGS